MAQFAQVIGLVSGVLGIVSFLQDNVPEKPEAMGTTIRVKVGIAKAEDDPTVVSAGGDVWAYTYGVNNEYQGESEHFHIDDGGIADLKIDASSPGARAEYVNIVSGYDATCIAWVSVSQYDDTIGSVWTGDVGSTCDQSWYPSPEFAGWLDEEKTQEYRPRCTWLDGDHTNDIPSASMKFTTLAFGEKATDTAQRGVSCGATRFGYDMAQIDDLPEQNSLPQKRSIKRVPWIQERLVISPNITSHTAESLCSSSTSFGPDFIGSDGYYCDMGTKTLVPLCSTKQTDGCFDMDDSTKTIMKRTSVGRRDVKLAHKSYKKVSYWK